MNLEQDMKGWTKPEQEKLPEPTWWPAALALGIVLLLWGIVASYAVSVVGLGLSITALAGWTGDIRNES